MAAVDRVIAALGVPTLLVNNAAATHLSGTGRDRDLLETEVGVWDESYRVNLRGTMLVTKTLLPHLLAVGDGHIVNLSSGSAAKAEPTRFAYSASKAGVESLTRNVAAFYGPRGIRCNAVAPGLVLTEAASAPGRSLDRFRSVFARHTPSALGTPEELAAVIAFLLSDDSRYINGVVLSVDGGLLAGQPYLADLLKR
jgi:NAD(P)-dependent dehydrogenase (short-subunit alcohol dehydrogenase family)